MVCRYCGAIVLGGIGYSPTVCWHCRRSLTQADIVKRGLIQRGKAAFEAIGALFSCLSAIVIWIAVAGGAVYGIVRFVRWAWYR